MDDFPVEARAFFLVADDMLVAVADLEDYDESHDHDDQGHDDNDQAYVHSAPADAPVFAAAPADQPPAKKVRFAITTLTKTRKQLSLRRKLQALIALDTKTQQEVSKEMDIPQTTLSGWWKAREKLKASRLPLTRRRVSGGGRKLKIDFPQVQYQLTSIYSSNCVEYIKCTVSVCTTGRI